jgi:FtsH-binding integral membrane protein
VKAEIYVEGQEFPYGKFTFGVLSTTYGLGIYYFLPYAMINQNLGLLMTIFFIFLEGLLIGLVILSYSLEFVFEKMLAKVVLFWVNTTDFKLTLKNLSSHRMQNRQTSILYALSISFIVMISVGFQLQIDATKDEYLMSMGGDIDMGGDSVNPAFINSFLHTLPGLDSVTFVSNHLT